MISFISRFIRKTLYLLMDTLLHTVIFGAKTVFVAILAFAISIGSIDYYLLQIPATEVKVDALREHPIVTFQKVRATYSDSAYIQLVPLVILDTDEVNAFTDYRKVYITKGLLKFVHSTDELAFVLGHELGHIYSGVTLQEHPLGYQGKESNHAKETRADEHGLYHANAAGYKACYGSEFFFRLANRFGNRDSDTHPMSSLRMMQNACRHIFKGDNRYEASR